MIDDAQRCFSNKDLQVRNIICNIKCPKCGSRDLADIKYGMMVDLHRDLKKAREAGRLEEGGCVVSA